MSAHSKRKASHTHTELELFAFFGGLHELHKNRRGRELWSIISRHTLQLLSTKKSVIHSEFSMLRNPTLAFKPSVNMSVRAEVSQLAPDRRSLYEVLHVKRNASQVEIKTAYRTLAKLHHPDARARFMDSSIATSADFIQIHNAYATLSDPNARAEYDLNLTLDSRGQWSPASVSSYRRPGRGRFYQTRRWETDQCW